MEAISVRAFRSNMAASFNLVDAGERVFVRRNRNLYAIVPIDDNDFEASPSLLAKINSAREEIANGECVVCKTKDDINAMLASL
ncbi:MAG: hypothetical protein MJ003_05000 [Paludibacteraceae bacterium]|nr:hypothetical protein [Paludibacteraceae bacterium]